MTFKQIALLGSAIVVTAALVGTAAYLERAPAHVALATAHRTPVVRQPQRLAQTDPNSGTPNGTQIQQSELDEEQAEQQQQQNPPPPPPPPPGR